MSALEGLAQCADAVTLKPALYRLCEKFGRIARLDILTAMQDGTRQAICFLKMESPDIEPMLMRSLGAGRFGGEIVFVVRLGAGPDGETPDSSSEWARL